MIGLLKRGGDLYQVSDEMIAKLQADYPTIDVTTELKKMANWLEANPANRKRDCHRFVINWLNRARPVRAGGVTPQTSNHYALVYDRIHAADPAPRPPADPAIGEAAIQDLKRMLGMRR
jgi:hypothetical protein